MDGVRVTLSAPWLHQSTVKAVRRGTTYAEFKQQLRDCLRNCPPGELSVKLKMGPKLENFEYADAYDICQELADGDALHVVVANDDDGGADGGGAADMDDGTDDGAADAARGDGGTDDRHADGDAAREDGAAAAGQKRPAEEEDVKLPLPRGRPKRAATQGPFKVGETVSVVIGLSHDGDPPKTTPAKIKEVNKGRNGNEYAIEFCFRRRFLNATRKGPTASPSPNSI